jgi:RNA polymerase subunit RPABC4/transcription elongation factor Spt4
MDELQCKDCGRIAEPITKNIYDYADADGNRGTWVEYDCCPYCGSDELEEPEEEE